MSEIARMKIHFYRCIQGSQEYGSNDEHMFSRIFFILEVQNKTHKLYADLKQTVGDDFEKGTIEVTPPEGYNGPFDYDEFRKASEKYFRSLVGSQGRAIRIEGASNVRMMGNEYEKPMDVEFDVKIEPPGL